MPRRNTNVAPRVPKARKALPNPDNKIRINFSIDPALKDRIDNIPWGTRSLLLTKLVTWLCDMYEKHGLMSIGMVLSGSFALVEAPPEEQKDGKPGSTP